MRNKIYVCRFLFGRYLRESDSLEDPALNVRIILKWMFLKWGVVVCTGLIRLRIDVRCLVFVNVVIELQVP
jgi:hypothetical protein